MRLKIGFVIVCLLFAGKGWAATGCSYPTTLDAYVDKISGDFLTVADVNSRTCAIEQAQLRVNQLFSGRAGGQTIKGGTAVNEGLFLQATAGAGAGAEFVQILGGNNGATLWVNFNGGKLLMGSATNTGSNSGDIVLNNAKYLRFVVAAGTTSANFGIGTDSSNNVLHDVPATGNLHVFRWAGTTQYQMLMSGSGVAQLYIGKATDPAAPGAGNAYLYHRDNGSGKGQIVARFPTGAVQVLATEP